MAFNVATTVAGQYGGLLTPRDLRDPREILSTSGTEAFQRASAVNQQALANLATAGLNAKARQAELGMQLDYNTAADQLILDQKRKDRLVNLAAAIGGGGTRKANSLLDGLGISLPSMDAATIAKEVAGWNQYFANAEDLLASRVGKSTARVDAGVAAALKSLGKS